MFICDDCVWIDVLLVCIQVPFYLFASARNQSLDSGGLDNFKTSSTQTRIINFLIKILQQQQHSVSYLK